MRHCGVMHLPGPLRAAVGLVATAADEAKHLPDRAIELPMLAVSSALQASLRAQQRYARLAARGDEVLNRRAASPTSRRPGRRSTSRSRPTTCAQPRSPQLDSLGDGGATSRLFDELFGVRTAARRTRRAGAGRSRPTSLTVVAEPDDDAGRRDADDGGKAGLPGRGPPGRTRRLPRRPRPGGDRDRPPPKTGVAKASESTAEANDRPAKGSRRRRKTAAAKTGAPSPQARRRSRRPGPRAPPAAARPSASRGTPPRRSSTTSRTTDRPGGPSRDLGRVAGAGPGRRDPHRRVDRPARRDLGRRPDRPAEPASRRGDAVRHAARPGRQHLADRHLPARGAARHRRRGLAGRAARPSGLLARTRHAEPARARGAPGRPRRAAGPARGAEQAARRRGAVRPRPQAAAAVPAAHHRPDHRPGQRGRARRRRERPPPAARRAGSGSRTSRCRASTR